MATQVTLMGISRHFRADEIEGLVRTAAEAVCGQLDDLSSRQVDLATRAYELLTARRHVAACCGILTGAGRSRCRSVGAPARGQTRR